MCCNAKILRKRVCPSIEGHTPATVSWMHVLLTLAVGLLFLPVVVQATRLKDIADIEGVRGNQLVGYGVVVGLNGTGDGNQVQFTTKSLSNMLQNLGVQVAANDIAVRNTAAVMVTAELPAFARPGLKINVTVSSMGDAQSLLGGTLIFTPLRGADGNIYATAQGPISVGGFSVSGDTDSVTQNHPTVGTMAGGAIVEREIPFDLFRAENLHVVLRDPDFTTMKRLVSNINRHFGADVATPLNSASLRIPMTEEMRLNPVTFVSELEQVEIEPDQGARVVVNERSGTVVIGENVRVSRVALAHGNLSIAIRTDNQVSQPPPLSNTGDTTVIGNTEVQVSEDTNRLSLVGGEVTLGEVVDALNALGATPRDLISIFNALKRAGALHAELVLM